MGKYKIKVNFDIINETNPEDKTTVTLDAPLTKDEIESIDDFERILLKLDRSALRKLMIEHFGEFSKKKPYVNKEKLEEDLKKMIRDTESTEK